MTIKMKEIDSTRGEIISVTKDASGMDVETNIGFYINEAQEPQDPPPLGRKGFQEIISELVGDSTKTERKEVVTKGKGDRDWASEYPEDAADYDYQPGTLASMIKSNFPD